MGRHQGNGGPTSSRRPQGELSSPSSGLRNSDGPQRQDENLPKTTYLTSELTLGGRPRRVGDPSANDAGESDDQDPLDHIPPLDLPGEVTRSSATPPPAPAAVGPGAKAHDVDNKAPDANPGAANPGAANPAAVRAETPGSAANELDLTSATILVRRTTRRRRASGPGSPRFVAVDVKLAGGKPHPTEQVSTGWSRRATRMVLDLRELRRRSWSSFIAEVTNLGLRYVVLPIGLEVDRSGPSGADSALEIARRRSSAVVFFDSDGTCAAALLVHPPRGHQRSGSIARLPGGRPRNSLAGATRPTGGPWRIL